MKIHHYTVGLVIALWILSLGGTQAATVTWSSGSSGSWSAGANWSGGVIPATGDEVTLGDVAASRTVTLDLTNAGASVSLSSLLLQQTTAGVAGTPINNQLALSGGAGTLTVGNAVTLGTGLANTTTSILITGTSNSSYVNTPALSVTGGTTINAGGLLQLAYASTPRGFVAMAGSITLSGGIIEALSPSSTQTAWLGGVAAGNNSALAGNDVFTINSGTIKVHGNGSNGSRLGFNGNFNWTGGTIQLVSDVTTSGQPGLFLHGLTNTISSGVVFQTVSPTGVVSAAAPTFTMCITTASPSTALTLSQTLDTAVTLGLMTIREFDTRTNSSYTHRITSTAAGRGIGQIFLTTSGAEDIVQLGSDLKSTYSAAGTFVTAQATGSPAYATFGVDLNGFTFDGTAASAGWVPNKVSGTTTNWKVVSSSGTGTFKAQSYNLGLSGATSADTMTVGSNVILEATGGSGTGNVLSTSGGATYAYHAASKFRYSGSATRANAATVSSAVAIGGLEVVNGALNLSQSAFQTQGDVSVTGGGSLDLNGTSIATLTLASGKSLTVNNGTMLLTLDGLGNSDQILSAGSGLADLTGGAFLLSGTINYAASYTVMSGFSTIAGADVVAISGYDSVNYQASLSSTGVLSFSTVPEPGTFGFVALGLMLWLGAESRARRQSRSKN